MMSAIVQISSVRFSETTGNTVSSNRSEPVSFRVAVVASCLALTSLPALAEEAKGPVGPAVNAWFTSSKSIVCADMLGNAPGPCPQERANVMKVFVSPDGSRAVAWTSWNEDGGNAESVATALFRRDGGTWRLERELSETRSPPVGDVTWSGEKVSYVVPALRDSDGRCCPTGRESRTMSLTSGVAQKVSAAAAPATSLKAPITGQTATHNGSMMAVNAAAGYIVYARPKPGLAPTVSPGTMLYRGSLAMSGAINGTAYAFKSGCAPVPYPVTGRVEGTRIVLRGPGPVRQGCDVVGYSAESPHSVLTFTSTSVDFKSYGAPKGFENGDS